MQPNADSHYSQQCLICYLLFRAREKALRSSIGCHILKAKLFNDVYCKFQRQEKSWIYLFDVKSHRYKNRRITYKDLEGTSSRVDFDLLRYFQAYLKLKTLVDQPIQELAVWTRTEFDRKDCVSRSILLDYTSVNDAVDLFETEDYGIRRYRLRYLAAVAETLLRSCDPSFKLATLLARLMFSRLPINAETIPKKLYQALLKDVFEDSRFRKEFLRDSDVLCSEAKQFHKLLVIVLGEQFQERNVTGFSRLIQIEQKPYAEYVELRIGDCESNSTTRDASWKMNHAVIRADIEQFFSLLVFYTNVPVKEEFRATVQRYCDQTMQGVLEGICQRGALLQNVQEEAIFELMSLKKLEDLGASGGLQFEYESLVELRDKFLLFLNIRSQRSCKTLVILSSGDLDVSASRVRIVLKELSCNYLFITGKHFLKQRNKLLHIMQVLKLSDQWILVITAEDSSTAEVLNSIDCLTIVIVSEVFTPHSADVLIHKDQFSFDDLTDCIKDRLQSTTILIQGHQSSFGALLNKAALSTIPVPALLDWNHTRDEIVIGNETDELSEDLFIHRYLQINNNSIVDPLETNFESLSILSGLPGMGKTFLLSMMVVNFRQKLYDHIVIKEDAKRIIDWFSSEIDGIELVAKLLNVKATDRIQKFVLQKLVEDRRMILLVDGFDEISRTKQKSALAMLKCIQSANFKLVIIATRPHRLPFLKDSLNNPAVYSMLPFNEEDLRRFLQHHLQSNTPNGILDMIRSFRIVFNDDVSLQIPLQCSILADIHREIIEDHPSNQLSVADVFQKFIDKTFELYACKSFDLFNRAHEVAVDTLRASFACCHSELAFRMDTHQCIQQESFENLEQYGLLRIDEGNVSFIHRSLTEFFVALYLVSHYVDQESFNRYLMERLCQSTTNRFDMFLEHHIHRDTSRRKLEGSPPSILGLDLAEFRVQQTHILPVEKLKQFHVFLVECCSVEKQVQYLRDSLAKGQLGIFETVYQSIPISLIHVVRFKFQSKTNDPFTVDLSIISEDSLLELLTILHRQNPLDIVEKIIASYDSDEDDFISTSIIHNYRTIIRQMFTIEQNLSSEDEGDLLLEYVHQRLQQYLTLAVEFGRDDLLRHTLDLLGERFHPRVIKNFLMNQSLQQVLFESCQAEDASAIVLQRVIAFLEIYLSDSDLRVLLNREFNGEGEFEEMLNKLKNPQVRAVWEALWKRYRTE